MENVIAAAIVAMFVIVLVFLLFRAFWLWYWRISEIVNLLKSIDKRFAIANGETIPEKTPGPILEKDGVRLSRIPD